MPLIEHEKMIKMYYEEVKDKYPELDFNEFERICKSPFIYIRQSIADFRLPIIFIQFLGKFRVYPGTLKQTLGFFTNQRKKDLITEEDYQEKKKYLEYNIKRFEHYDANYKVTKKQEEDE